MGWVESGRAWGERATDWAYLAEPYARSANDALFDRTGVGPADRGMAQVVTELPDLDLTVRALAASGPSWPAIQNVGYDQFAETLLQAMRPLHVDGIGVRIVSEFGWIIGKVPAT